MSSKIEKPSTKKKVSEASAEQKKPRKKVSQKASQSSAAPKARGVRVTVSESAKLKEKILYAFLKQVVHHGWCEKALLEAAKALGQDEMMAYALFPQKELEALNVWARDTSDEMMRKLKKLDLEAMKVRMRIFWAVRVYLTLLEGHKKAASKAFLFLCHPRHATQVPPLLYEITHNMWCAAGDTSTDYNFYTKRLLLAGVFSTTFLYWLQDTSPENHETWKFLEKRIENVLLLQKVKTLNLFDFLKGFKDMALKEGTPKAEPSQKSPLEGSALKDFLPFAKMLRHFLPF